MQLYVVRHGAAAQHAAGGDAARPLTEAGALEVAAVGRGLRALGVALDALVASPLLRAQQTARILSDTLGAPEPETEALLDGSAAAPAILRELATWTRGRGRLAIVGHQPVLGELVTLASFGAGRASVALPPGGVARIDFAGTPRVASAVLVWLVTPDLMGRLS